MNTWHLTAGVVGKDGVEKLDQWIVHREPYDARRRDKNDSNKGQTLELEILSS